MTERMINQLDTEKLHDIINHVAADRDLGKYIFRVRNEWIEGAHCRSKIKGFCSAGQEDNSRQKEHVLEGDEPVSLLGQDKAPNATEALLHALAACLNASFIYHASEQGIKIDQLQFDIEGELDLNGFLGIDENVPSGFQVIRVECTVHADAPKKKLEELLEYAKKRSPVFNTVTKSIPVRTGLGVHGAKAAAY